MSKIALTGAVAAQGRIDTLTTSVYEKLRELGLPTGLSSILSEGGAYRVRIDVPVKQRALV